MQTSKAGLRTRISPQQQAILDALATAERGWMTESHFHAVLWGKTWPRKKREIPPLTGTQRASLSRSLRRLRERGLIARCPVVYRLTDAGCEYVERTGAP
jgi:DNA-binding MarR family transcriptional regulator